MEKNSKVVGGGAGRKEKMSKKELNLVGSGGEVVEFFDGSEQMMKKVGQVMELVRNAKHMTAFTGAGISTSAGTLSRYPSLSPLVRVPPYSIRNFILFYFILFYLFIYLCF